VNLAVKLLYPFNSLF